MSEIQFTPEQEAAIFSTGKNILVSASAGSGKTFVMANRIVEKIRSGILIHQLFISTFTKKAAAELRLRLEKDLKVARKKTKSDEERYRFTLALQDLSTADIGTMDSFTQKLVREFFNRINIDPNFRILADKSESDLMKQEIFETLVENHLSSDAVSTDNISKSNFKKLLKNFSKDRNINGFQEVVYNVYNFMSSTENPIQWLEKNFDQGYKKYQKFSDFPQNDLANVLESLEKFFELLEQALTNKVISGKVGVSKASHLLDYRETLLSALTALDFGKFSRLFLELDTDIRVGSSKDETILALKRDFSAQKQKLVGTKSNPGIIFSFFNQIKHTEIIEKYQPEALQIVHDLQAFMVAFYQQYLDKKRRENAFEYSDIAHFAIEILEENPDIRVQLKEHYHEIMIDEYQDTSHTQERLLNLLSNGQNLFMVGDIKQSIYGFRLADPGLFLEKYKSFDQTNNPNQLIRLKENFRSRGEVLTFTNEVFKHLMNEEIGEMTYGAEEKLIQGNTTDYPEKPDPAYYPELLLYNQTEESEINETETELSDGEIRVAAQKIQELIDSGVEPKTIALLVRSKTNNNKIEDILSAYGIPVVLDEGRVDFLKSMEVLVMLDVLRAIDNPLYDVPLVAMLRSPLFDFNEDELTRISLQAGKETRFFEKIQMSLHNQGNHQELISSQFSQKLQQFYGKFTDWRKLVNQITIHELLWKIYIETYYFDYVGALENGEMRQANLQALSIRAEAYESSGYKGLFKFIRLIDKFMEQKNDLAAVNIKLPENAVRVMTFHKSKGLEFDYVFLMNLQSRFNERDLSENIIITRENGVGIKYTADLKKEPDVRTHFPYALVKMETFPFMMNKELKRKANLSEEMRVLYVAFTRAKKKLFMVGVVKETAQKPWADAYSDAVLEKNQILTDSYRKSSLGFEHWILALQAATKLSMKLKIYTHQEIKETTSLSKKPLVFEQLMKEAQSFDGIMEVSDEVKRASTIMNFEYPYHSATLLASIQTPSQIKKRSYEKQLELGHIQPTSEFVRTKELSFSSLKQTKISAAQIGSATHEFMQNADFSHPDKAHFEATLDSLSFDEAIKEKIDVNRILTLFETEFGKILVDNVDNIVKEAPFSMLKTDHYANEQYIVRGICDGYLILDEKILLFDYKTDHFSKKEEIEQIKTRYQSQMELYSEALSHAYPKIKRIEKYLILLGGPESVIVEQIN